MACFWLVIQIGAAIEDLVRRLAKPGHMHVLNVILETDGATYPYGCHIVEVEIDKMTCAVQVLGIA